MTGSALRDAADALRCTAEVVRETRFGWVLVGMLAALAHLIDVADAPTSSPRIRLDAASRLVDAALDVRRAVE